MFYQHFRPSPALRPYIESFWIIKASAESAVTRTARMPADSRATLLLSFDGETRLVPGEGETQHFSKGAVLLGVHNQSYTLEHDGNTDLIAAQFRPGGLASFVRYGAGEIAEQTIPLDLLWGSAGNSVFEQIYEAGTTIEKVALYQSALLKRFAEVPHQSRILRALAHIDAAPDNLSVEWLATQTSLSQKQFERVFERMVGMMPKRYIRLARFQKLVRWLRSYAGTANWTMLAAQFGYYDHAHMAKDFQAFASTTPGKFTTATAGVVEVAYGGQVERQEV